MKVVTTSAITGSRGRGRARTPPLPAFGSQDFSGATINGDPLATSTPTASTYYEAKKDEITTGPITDGGTAFALTQVS